VLNKNNDVPESSSYGVIEDTIMKHVMRTLMRSDPSDEPSIAKGDVNNVQICQDMQKLAGVKLKIVYAIYGQT